MKIVSAQDARVWYVDTDDGVSYRANGAGTEWERLYGMSWEHVSDYTEEYRQLCEAWTRHYKEYLL